MLRDSRTSNNCFHLPSFVLNSLNFIASLGFFVVIPHTYPWHLIPSGWMQRRRSTRVWSFFMWYPSGIKRIDCARRSFSRKENFLVSNGDILCGANFWRIFVKRRSSRIWLNCGGPEFPPIFLATLYMSLAIKGTAKYDYKRILCWSAVLSKLTRRKIG